MNQDAEQRPPLPPFTQKTVLEKVRKAEDAWNTRDPMRVAAAYTIDSHWRNRSEIFEGRAAIIGFLTQKWRREMEYRLVKEVWAFGGHRIAVRFAYEWRNQAGAWFRSYGNENWDFDENGLMRERHASVNDVAIEPGQRKFFWDAPAPRPAEHPGLSELGL